MRLRLQLQIALGGVVAVVVLEGALDIDRFAVMGWSSGGPYAAVCGARFEDVPAWRPIRVERGGRIRFGKRLQGCRAYLSVSGGFDVETRRREDWR